MGEQVLSLTQALVAYQTFVDLPEVGLHGAPANRAIEIQRIVSIRLRKRMHADAHSAAFRKRILTSDQRL